MNSQDNAMVLESVKGLRRILSIEPTPPVEEVLAADCLNYFVGFLSRHDFMELQFEAAWALTNIASTDKTRSIVDAGAVPMLAQLLLSPNPDVREQCAWCLGNVAGDCPELRDYVLQSGALQPLLQNIAQPAHVSMLRNTVWGLSNFCRGKPQPKLESVAAAVPALAQTVAQDDKEVIMDSCWALSYLSDGENERVEAVVQTGVVGRLVQLLRHSSASVITPALRTIGNIVSGSDTQTQSVLDAGGLQAVLPLLTHPKKGIRKESCWMLSNVAAGSRDQISSLLAERDLIDGVLEHLSGDEWDVRKEAAWVISNIVTGGSHEQVVTLLRNHDVIQPLCSLLNVSDSKILMVGLDALESLLKCGEKTNGLVNVAVHVDEADGLELLENLQEHENEEIYNKAVNIIETFFGTEDENEPPQTIAPATSGDAFAFGKPSAGAIVPAGGFNLNFKFNLPN